MKIASSPRAVTRAGTAERRLAGLAALALLVAQPGPARAQSTPSRSDPAPAAPTGLPGQSNPRIVPGLVRPVGPSGRNGPPAPVANELET